MAVNDFVDNVNEIFTMFVWLDTQELPEPTETAEEESATPDVNMSTANDDSNSGFLLLEDIEDLTGFDQLEVTEEPEPEPVP